MDETHAVAFALGLVVGAALKLGWFVREIRSARMEGWRARGEVEAAPRRHTADTDVGDDNWKEYRPTPTQLGLLASAWLAGVAIGAWVLVETMNPWALVPLLIWGYAPFVFVTVRRLP